MARESDFYQIGLTTAEAEKRAEKYGKNILNGKKRSSAYGIFFSQFKDALILILLASTVISTLMGEYMEALTIITIVFLNATVGFIQEYRTERTLDALKKLAAPIAKVLRNRKKCEIDVGELVPGDVIFLNAGDRVPADAKIVESVNMSADESILSGESLNVEKTVSDKDAFGKVYMGSLITKGRGKAIVTQTGMNTKMGGIAGMLTEIEEVKTPLQLKLASMGKIISVICILICFAVTGIGVIRGENIFDMFLTGLSLAVAVIPEGLPAVVTIALGLGVSRMLKKRALVRRLHSVETLGCADVICSDKTGTLTENNMTVKELSFFDKTVETDGGKSFYIGENEIDPRDVAEIRLAAYISVLCSSETVERDEKGNINITGDPTEKAILTMAVNSGTVEENKLKIFKKVFESPFDSVKKTMSVGIEDKNGDTLMLIKGAPDMIIPRCEYYYTDKNNIRMEAEDRKKIINIYERMSDKALRVIALGYKKIGKDQKNTEDNLVFAGLIGMMDPPRKEAGAAVEKCKSAGIRTIMITGDGKNTAVAIAKKLKIIRNSEAVTGEEIDKMGDTQFRETVKRVSVFARVSPAHKLRIVKALKSDGHIVAMTGDGVNDAPAVKEADIGVSMGEGGADVTKEASEIILLDDNFSTLVCAVEEGRIIYGNIRKFIRYLLSCNIGEALTMFLGMLIGMKTVFLPIQILLVNLVTDSLPAIALGFEPGENVMKMKPRRKDEGVFSGGLLSTIIFRGCLIGISTLSVYTCFMRGGENIVTARTAALVVLILAQLIHVFECKSEKKGIFGINPFTNPYIIAACLISFGVMAAALYIPVLNPIFGTVPLSLTQFLIAVSFAFFAPVVSGIFKILEEIFKKKKILNDNIVSVVK